MNGDPKSPEPISPEYRVRRNARHVQPAENIPIGELETHYKRLSRVNEENLWKKGFGLFAVVMMGGVVGAALAGPGWTWEVKAAAALTVLAGLGWKGMAQTESEGIKAIRDDYKEDILDSLILVPVDGGTPPRKADSTSSQESEIDEERLNQEIEELIARLREAED